MMILMRSDSEMPMVEDVCLRRLDAGVGPTVGAAQFGFTCHGGNNRNTGSNLTRK